MRIGRKVHDPLFYRLHSLALQLFLCRCECIGEMVEPGVEEQGIVQHAPAGKLVESTSGHLRIVNQDIIAARQPCVDSQPLKYSDHALHIAGKSLVGI